MSGLSRRHLLAGAAGLATLTAGCLDGGGLATSPGPSDDDENATNDESGDDDGDDGSEDDEQLESTTVAFQHGDRPQNPSVDLLTSEDQANRWISDRSIEDDTVSEFVDETDFDEAGVIALEAGANTACYEMAVDSVGLEDETVTVHAEVTETGDENQLCAQQLTAVDALVRASVDGERPASISVTIVDADGTEHGRETSASSGSASASESTSTDRSESETGADAASETDAGSD